MLEAIHHHASDEPIFEAVGVDEAMAEAFSERVDLPSGAYLVIEHTEAMHVIDVNSGRAGRGESQEENSLKVDLEAASSLAHQLRLRDLGGIIVVDFIDLRDEKNRNKVVNRLKKEFRKDRAVTKVLPMSDFGLIQITRQRLRPSITTDESAREAEQAASSEPAKAARPPRRTPPSRVDVGEVLKALDGELASFKKNKEVHAVTLKVHPFFGAYLTKGLPSRLNRLRFKHRIRIRLEEDQTQPPSGYKLSADKDAGAGMPPEQAQPEPQPRAAESEAATADKPERSRPGGSSQEKNGGTGGRRSSGGRGRSGSGSKEGGNRSDTGSNRNEGGARGGRSGQSSASRQGQGGKGRQGGGSQKRGRGRRGKGRRGEPKAEEATS
jgi:ribonuclease G